MNNPTKNLLPLLIGAWCAGVAAAAEPAASNDSITIYSSLQPGAVSPELYRPVAGRNFGGQVPGYAIVRHDRSYDIEKGLRPLRVSDVAALIDPTTVTFASLDEPGTRVLEQSFQFDLVSQAKLLQRYLGQRVTVELPRGDSVDLAEGILLGAGDGLTLQMDDGSVQAVRSYSNIRFSQLPGGLITRPTLEWLLDSPASGSQQTRISYETRGMTWWTDYNIIYDESRDCSMDLSAWVSIINQSGAGYSDARLKLIAGDVNRAESKQPRRDVVYKMAMAEEAAGFVEKTFFEYHLYTLGRPTSLPDNSTKQIQLMPTARGIKCKKELVFAPTLDIQYYGYQQFNQEYGRYGNGDVNVFLRFENDKSQQLGIPLPAGRIRVNQADPADGSLEFIGEDVIGHTPRNEDVLIEMGNAFDVVGERKQTDFRVDTRTRNLWETFEITLRNHKDDAVEVAVLENLYRAANWKIENASQAHQRENSNRIRFDVKVPSEGERVVRYTVHYSW
ncbi:MAG: DUF4139 domain-containing protein [Xanthomonadales bacterium]|nr:DUF4139 domain-containing protein [Gammaproteobacteria bacterium]MBT8054658.1 DUF4139 domain-containing protein [Gammaproteobacteria bacterium]NND55748.1 DUF4139 domain-containing protein [Xanthomonadales bacterium]NNK50159.1 DUF4139 domain-containing protein [Xanthomonadales bacterium]